MVIERGRIDRGIAIRVTRGEDGDLELDVERFLGDADFRAQVEPRFVRVSGRMHHRLAAPVVSALGGFDVDVPAGSDLASGALKCGGATHDAVRADWESVLREPFFLACAVLDD